MEEIDIVQISKSVLASLATIGYEKNNLISTGQLIFPLKNQANRTKEKDRISEQELRQLFIEKFKNYYLELYYSIETPTQAKYKFGKIYERFEHNENGQSALLDMCIFNRVLDCYNRILNIEFKSNNPVINGVGKDILKLMNEKQNGSFIHLLKNTNKNTLKNETKTGVFDKFYKSFSDFQKYWKGGDKKYIQLFILSLEQNSNRTKVPILMYRKIVESDLLKLKEIFSCSDLVGIKDNGWDIISISKK
ncbi:MAG: hypothetical protein GZ091_12305 [Paludibacter sp.]|nr:hypothetical protein [Paludibacter sp.]